MLKKTEREGEREREIERDETKERRKREKRKRERDIGEIMMSSEGVRKCVVCPTDITVKKYCQKSATPTGFEPATHA